MSRNNDVYLESQTKWHQRPKDVIPIPPLHAATPLASSRI